MLQFCHENALAAKPGRFLLLKQNAKMAVDFFDPAKSPRRMRLC
jgi:hypothetical protein